MGYKAYSLGHSYRLLVAEQQLVVALATKEQAYIPALSAVCKRGLGAALGAGGGTTTAGALQISDRF